MKSFWLRVLVMAVTRLTGKEVIERLKLLIVIAAEEKTSGEEKRRYVMDAMRNLMRSLTRDIGTNLIDLARAVLVAWLRSQQRID